MNEFTVKANPLSWDQAASILGTKKTPLMRELKERQILVATEFGARPAAQYRDFFFEDHRSTREHGKPTRHYVVLMITIKGLAFLEAELSKKPAQAA